MQGNRNCAPMDKRVREHPKWWLYFSRKMTHLFVAHKRALTYCLEITRDGRYWSQNQIQEHWKAQTQEGGRSDLHLPAPGYPPLPLRFTKEREILFISTVVASRSSFKMLLVNYIHCYVIVSIVNKTNTLINSDFTVAHRGFHPFFSYCAVLLLLAL